MLVLVSDMEIAIPVEGQTVGMIELICSASHSISTQHNSALCRPAMPTHHSTIRRVGLVGGAGAINQ